MTDYLIILLLIIEVIVLSRIDYLLYKTYITPFIALSVPYTIVVTLAFFVAPHIDFVTLYTPSVLIWIVGLFVFWLAGLIMFVLFWKKIINIKNPFQEIFFEYKWKKFILIISWVAIIAMVVGAFKAANNYEGIMNIGSDDFTTYYGSGMSGHFLVLSIMLLIYLIGVGQKKNIFYLLTILILFTLIFLYQVKGIVFLTLVSAFIYRYLRGKLKITLLKIIISIIGIGFLFFCAYYPSLGLKDKDFLSKPSTYVFFQKHISKYFFAGVLGFSEYTKHNNPITKNETTLLQPAKNIYFFLINNDYENIINKKKFYIDKEKKEITNVNTFIGTTYILGGPFWGAVYIYIISSLLYFTLCFVYLTKNVWILVIYSFFTGGICFGWFDMYPYNSLMIVEIPLYALILFNFSYYTYPSKMIKQEAL